MIGFDWLCAWVYAFCFIVSASVIQIHGSNDTYGEYPVILQYSVP